MVFDFINYLIIKGTLQIVDNPALVTLAGLDNIDYTTIENMTITGCRNLDYCAVSSICDYLNFGRNAVIFDNAAGCNTKQTVLSANAACAPNFTSQTKSLWQTNQGRLLLLLTTLAVVGAFAAWVFYRRRQRNRYLKLRAALAQDLHDDLGSEMSGIALSSYAAARSGDPSRMSAALEHIARQSQKLVEDMRDMVWSIHPDNDTLEKMTGRMKQHASNLLHEQDVALRFEVSPDALRIKMEPEARKQLYLLFTQLGSEKIEGIPSMVSWGPNRIDVFVQGTDKVLYTKSWDGSKWSGYTQLGGEKIEGNPTVVSWAANRIDVFVRGTDNALYTKSWNGSKWSGYTQLGSEKIEGIPSVVSWGPNRIDVFVRGTDKVLYTKSWNGTKWSGYTQLGSEKIEGTPSVVSWGAKSN